MSLSPKAEANLLTHFNGTIPLGVYPNCTLRVNCLLDGYFKAQINYYPSLGGNIFCLSIFAIFLVAQATQGILWRTWKYSTAMVLGLVLECVGYYGRVALNRNPYVFNSFLMSVLLSSPRSTATDLMQIFDLPDDRPRILHGIDLPLYITLDPSL